MTEVTPLVNTNKYVTANYSFQDNKKMSGKDIIIPLVSEEGEKDLVNEAIDKKVIDNLNNKILEALNKLKYEKNIKETGAVITKLAEERKKSLSKEDTRYWAELILKTAEEAGISHELVAAIIAKETLFEKNVDNPGGAGPMQVVTVTISDMFSNSNGGRKSLYDLIDKAALDKILYKTDETGNIITDDKGNPIRRYNSPAELRQACGKNDQLGIEVGVICLKMKFAECISRIKGIPLKNTITKLKSGELKLSDEELKRYMLITLKNYNSVFNEYAPAVVDSLQNSSHSTDSFNLYRVPIKK